MAFVKTHPPEKATGLMKDQYDNTRNALGMRADEYSKLLEAWSLQPEVAGGWLAWHAGARAKTGLTPIEYELVECRMMYLAKSRCVLVNHAALLAKISGFNMAQLKQVIHDPAGSNLNPRQKALIRFAEKITLRHHEMTRDDVDALRPHGCSDEQIVALVFMLGSLLLNAVLPTALGAELDPFSKDYYPLADW
jgi:alkylhydroperoxidase family enzyme